MTTPDPEQIIDHGNGFTSRRSETSSKFSRERDLFYGSTLIVREIHPAFIADYIRDFGDRMSAS